MSPVDLSANGSRIRSLIAHDWAAVSSIYRAGILTGQATFETEAPSWDDWNRNHLESPRLVATSCAQVVGWAALSPISRRSVYTGVAETSVYVSEHWWGKGVGRALLERLVLESEGIGIWTLQASIFPENVASVNLHTSCGFRVVGTRKHIGKLNGVWRDTLLLERRSIMVGSD